MEWNFINVENLKEESLNNSRSVCRDEEAFSKRWTSFQVVIIPWGFVRAKAVQIIMLGLFVERRFIFLMWAQNTFGSLPLQINREASKQWKVVCCIFGKICSVYKFTDWISHIVSLCIYVCVLAFDYWMKLGLNQRSFVEWWTQYFCVYFVAKTRNVQKIQRFQEIFA